MIVKLAEIPFIQSGKILAKRLGETEAKNIHNYSRNMLGTQVQNANNYLFAKRFGDKEGIGRARQWASGLHMKKG